MTFRRSGDRIGKPQMDQVWQNRRNQNFMVEAAGGVDVVAERIATEPLKFRSSHDVPETRLEKWHKPKRKGQKEQREEYYFRYVCRYRDPRSDKYSKFGKSRKKKSKSRQSKKS